MTKIRANQRYGRKKQVTEEDIEKIIHALSQEGLSLGMDIGEWKDLRTRKQE